MRNYILIGLLLLAACKKNNTGGGDALSSNFTITPSSGPGGMVVAITGKGFGTDTGAIKVSFNGTPAMVQNIYDTFMLVTVPNGTTGPVTVSKGGQEAKGPTFTFQSLSITGISPAAGPSGIRDTITGTGLNFSGEVESQFPAVYFNGKVAKVVSQDTNRLIVIVPDTPGVGPITVVLGNMKATGPVFNYLGIVSVSPLTGNVGTVVTISGGFGAGYASATVTINGKQASVTGSSVSQIVCTVPAGDTTGPLQVHVNGQTLSGGIFTFVPPPTIASVLPNSGPAGTRVTINGANFSAITTEDAVSFSGTPATIVSASGTQLVCLAPAGATNGPVVITVNGQTVTGPVYKYQSLGITGINPANGAPPCVVTISGFGFGTVAASDIVTINGTTCPITSVVDTQLVVNVPAGTTGGVLTVQQGSLVASGPVFSTAGVFLFAGGSSGLQNGVGAQAQFEAPRGLVVDAGGNLYVDDISANNIRKVAPDGTVTNFAGDPGGGSGYQDGMGSGALFSTPYNIAIDQAGNLYVSDHGNGAIRKIAPNGTVSTLIASMPDGGQPVAVTVDNSGNVYVTEFGPSIFKFNSAGGLLNTTTIPGTVLDAVVVDNGGNVYCKDYQSGNIYKGTTLVTSFGYSFYGNMKLAADGSGNILVANGILSNTNAIYSFNPTTLAITLLTGDANGASGSQNGPLQSALFNWPDDVAQDAHGNIYVTEQNNYDVRKISLH